MLANGIWQGFSNFFQVGTIFISQNVLRTTFISQNVLRTTFISQNVLRTTFISQNVLWTTLLLSPLKANLSFFKMFSAYVNTSIMILLK
jgi:hypothetical protein